MTICCTKQATAVKVPEWLAHLENVIFQGLDITIAKNWSFQFLQAIPVGVSEEQFQRLYYQQALKRQQRNLKVQQKLLKNHTTLYKDQLIKALSQVVEYYKEMLNSDVHLPPKINYRKKANVKALCKSTLLNITTAPKHLLNLDDLFAYPGFTISTKAAICALTSALFDLKNPIVMGGVISAADAKVFALSVDQSTKQRMSKRWQTQILSTYYKQEAQDLLHLLQVLGKKTQC